MTLLYAASRLLLTGLAVSSVLTFRTLGALRPPRRAFTAPRATRAVEGGVGSSQVSLRGATLAGGAQSRVEGGLSM